MSLEAIKKQTVFSPDGTQGQGDTPSTDTGSHEVTTGEAIATYGTETDNPDTPTIVTNDEGEITEIHW
jgi:hypothetical protein